MCLHRSFPLIYGSTIPHLQASTVFGSAGNTAGDITGSAKTFPINEMGGNISGELVAVAAEGVHRVCCGSSYERFLL